MESTSMTVAMKPRCSLLSPDASRRVENINDSCILVAMRAQFPVASMKTTVKIDWSLARAWVASDAEAAGDVLSADDDTGSKAETKCIPGNAILSHLNKQPLFRLGGAQTC
eukprot:6177026-Pleurochrysis_carterae.AAC.1